MDLILQLLVILVFLVLKGFFSGSELAMVNSDRIHLRHEARMGWPGTNWCSTFFHTQTRMLGTTLVGTNIATVITTLGTLIFVRVFGDAGDLILVLVFTPFLLIFRRDRAQSIFQQKADTIVTRIIYGLRFFSYVFYPVTSSLAVVAGFAAHLFGGAGRRRAASSARTNCAC